MTQFDEILDLMKSASVDCKLNEPEIQGDYKCLDFGDSDELAYNPKYSKNSAVEVRKKKIEYNQLTNCLISHNYFQGHYIFLNSYLSRQEFDLISISNY